MPVAMPAHTTGPSLGERRANAPIDDVEEKGARQPGAGGDSSGALRCATLLAVALALAVRLSFVVRADFPLNDGGLFYTMVRDLQASGYHLPEQTSYNGAGLPFAYPPLGFYVAGLTEDLTGISLFTLLRLLPLLWSLLALVAFWRLACVALPSRHARVAALFAFAVVPNVYEWTLMGGGLTRGLGLACALFMLGEVWRLFAGGSRWHALSAVLAGAATVLSHPDAAWFAAYSGVLLAVVVGRSWRAVGEALLVGTGVATLTAPWWLTTATRYGRAAIPTSMSVDVPPYAGLVRFGLLALTREPFVPVVCVLALLGLLVCLGRRRVLLPLWFLVTGILEPRAIDQLGVLLALLAGIGIADILVPLLTARWSAWREEGPGTTPRPFHSRVMPRFALVIIAYATMLPIILSSDNMQALSGEERAAIGWVGASTPTGARVLVLSGSQSWEADRVSEWLPALTGRQSVATPQGYEWGGDFYARTAAHRKAQACLAGVPTCLDDWAASNGEPFEYVYVAKAAPQWNDPSHSWGVRDTTVPFRALMDRDPRWQRVYDGSAATIYRRVDASLGDGSAQAVAPRE